MKPLRMYINGSSRQSMEPLLKEKEDPFSRSSSPSSVSSAGSQWNPGPLVRRQRLLAIIGVISLLAISFAGYHAYSSFYTSKPSTFDIVLALREEPYVVAKDGQKIFDWREDAFLPASPSLPSKIFAKARKAAGYSVPDPAPPKHTVVVQPKDVNLEGLPDRVRNEEIVFGFTSPYHRAREMCGTWRHYLQHGAQCVIVLPKEEYLYKRDMEFYLEQENIRCKVETVDLGQYPRYEHRVMNMPRMMRNLKWTDAKGQSVQPKWYIVADDDTQVLDMAVLRREMSKRLNTEDHMLCAVTESKQQLGRHGKICYGGGGIVISAALTEKMSTRMGECLWWHHWRFGGDEMVTHCASTVLSTATKNVPPAKTFEDVVGLHQIDIPGDGSGVFQSGLPFITIHHYTGWLSIFPEWHAPDRLDALRKLQKSVSFLGGDNLFKRYVFDDGSTFMSLGYSITLYSQPLKKYEMRLMEKTYRSEEHELRWPARPEIPEGKSRGRYKTTYYFLDVLEDERIMIYQNKRGDTIRVHLEA